MQGHKAFFVIVKRLNHRRSPAKVRRKSRAGGVGHLDWNGAALDVTLAGCRFQRNRARERLFQALLGSGHAGRIGLAHDEGTPFSHSKLVHAPRCSIVNLSHAT